MARFTPATETGDAAVPDHIADSWNRSSACGLQRTGQHALPYSAEALEDSPLLRAAGPVLDRLDQALLGAPASVMLADESGRLVDQRVGGRRPLHAALRTAGAAPGVWFAEEFAGTNGIGTTVEDAAVTTVHGDQHFVDYLRHLSCVGAPIRHPITSSVRGVLDLTTLVDDYNPMMAPLMFEAVKHIETRLVQFSGPHEVELMEEFRRTSSKCHGPVVGVASNVFLSNTAAAGVIQPYDHTLLWELATSLSTSAESVATIELAGGPCVATCTPIAPTVSKEPAYVLRLEYRGRTTGRRRGKATRATSALDLPGRSAFWRQGIDELRQQVNDSTPVAILGEDGLGKVTLAEQLHTARARHDEAQRQLITTTEPDADQIVRTLEGGTGVILRCTQPPRTDQLSQLATRAHHAAEADQHAGHLVLTVRLPYGDERTIEQALTAIATSVSLPPLRRRSEDIADIVPALLRTLTNGARLRCSPSAMQVLMKARWPQNVSELERVLRHTCAEARSTELQPSDLPHWLVAESSGRALSTYERTERDLIIEALRGAGNNRTQAAKTLGIGRATLYRKMRSLAIPMAGRHIA